MHDLLEAYARKRRSAAGDPAGQPHPVTRRLLQTEVRQVYAAKLAPKAPGGLSGWLGLSWPRLLVGSAAFALVAVTTTLVLRQESQPNRALKREESASAPVLRAPAGPEGDRQAKRDGDGPRPGEPAKPALVTASDAGLAPAVAKETQSREALESLRLREDKAAPARTKNEEETASAAVLSEFQLEQNGDVVRVIDSDGSVYDGVRLAPSSAPVTGAGAASGGRAGRAEDSFRQRVQLGESTTRRLTATAAAAAAASPAAGPTELLNFRVSGTNRTLRQAVQLEGVLLETAAAPLNAIAQSVPDPAAAAPAARSTSLAPVPASRGVAANAAPGAPRPNGIPAQVPAPSPTLVPSAGFTPSLNSTALTQADRLQQSPQGMRFYRNLGYGLNANGEPSAQTAPVAQPLGKVPAGTAAGAAYDTATVTRNGGKNQAGGLPGVTQNQAPGAPGQQRIQGMLRIGATNQIPLDAYRP